MTEVRSRPRRVRRTRSVVGDQPPAIQPRLSQPLARVISDDEVESIHLASLEVLNRTGIDILHAQKILNQILKIFLANS